jgi:hypothetical protein
MYEVSSRVSVEEVEENSWVVFTWSGYTPNNPTTVEFRFIRMRHDTTYVQVTESGFTGTGDQLVRYVADSTSGFTFLVSALKALLEHDIALALVLDAHPADLDAWGETKRIRGDAVGAASTHSGRRSAGALSRRALRRVQFRGSCAVSVNHPRRRS